jgi:hypothetical protein
MRIDTLRFLLPLLLGSLSAPLPALARVTANVPWTVPITIRWISFQPWDICKAFQWSTAL